MVVICSYGFCGGWWMGQLGNGFSLFLCYNTCSFDISTFFSLFLYIWLLRKWWKRKKYLVGQIW